MIHAVRGEGMNELIEIADINPEFRIQFNTYACESAILIQPALTARRARCSQMTSKEKAS